jgi:hypothetical protein
LLLVVAKLIYQQQFENARLQTLESAKATIEVRFHLTYKYLIAMTFPNDRNVRGGFD